MTQILEMKIEGIDEVYSALKSLQKAGPIEDALAESARMFSRAVKEVTPKDTGNARRSWLPRKLNPASWIVYSEVNYVPDIYYGVKKESSVVNDEFLSPGRPLIDVLQKLIEQWTPMIQWKVEKGIEDAINDL